MSDWSLQQLLSGLHDDIQQKLATVRRSFGHPGRRATPVKRFGLSCCKPTCPNAIALRQRTSSIVRVRLATRSTRRDRHRQYSPFIFNYQGETIIPAESVYAVFEAKQTINANQVEYAQQKVASVRRLHRTSLPIPHAGGVYPPKPLQHILGGLLTLESDWTPPLGDALTSALAKASSEQRLDLGCVAAHGMFGCDSDGCHIISPIEKPATAFLLELIALLQENATVPMIDVRAYAQWLV